MTANAGIQAHFDAKDANRLRQAAQRELLRSWVRDSEMTGAEHLALQRRLKAEHLARAERRVAM
jgi:hypothetical protein